MDLITTKLAYFMFHFVILLSLSLGKLLYKKMKLPSLLQLLKILPIIIFFIIWDAVATGYWWDFNYQYTFFKWRIFGLPIEEILFFFTVPLGLITFTENLFPIIKNTNISLDWSDIVALIVSLKLFLIIIFITSLFSSWFYSAFVCFLLIHFIKKSVLINKVFLAGIIFTICTTLIFNYYLTYLPIVTYNNIFKSNIHVGTIPIEDFGYGLLMYLMIIKTLYGQDKLKIS